MSTPSAVATAFDTFSDARLKSPTLEKVWQEAYGQDYAAEVKPNAFYPQSVLDSIITNGNKGRGTTGRTLLDIGCGHGMTGLYLAQRMDMKLVGIDISPCSIELARKTASGHAAQFWVADASSTKVEDGVCTVVTFLDVLLYVPDKAAMFKEVHRILQPGGFFAFTTWEQHGFNERLGAKQVANYRPLLEDAGFHIQIYEAVERAREQHDRIFEGLIGNEDKIREEIGEAAAMYAKMGRSARKESAGRRYVFGIACKESEPS